MNSMEHISPFQGNFQFSCKSVQEETLEILVIHVTLTEFKLTSTPRPTSRSRNEIFARHFTFLNDISQRGNQYQS
jgi:hypothetical protein